MSNGMLATIAPLALLLLVMYFLLIRPQKKKERQTNEMRRSVRSGDEIVTIGGLCGKVIKAREDSLVIQVGADKVKLEIMRWAVSKIVDSVPRPEPVVQEEPEEEEAKAALPKKLKKGTDNKSKK